MKVVINKCYGGFGLSDRAIELCIELGMTVSDNKSNRDVDFIKNKKKLFGSRFWPAKVDSKEFRCNPTVVKVVEELGDEAHKDFAKLKVVEIPFDGLDGWEIHDYDGMETIEEDHQSWD